MESILKPHWIESAGGRQATECDSPVGCLHSVCLKVMTAKLGRAVGFIYNLAFFGEVRIGMRPFLSCS
jgi:hypothetical protein